MANPTSPLDNLHDVIAPATVSWWPLSVPAFTLIAILITLIIAAIYVCYKRYQLAKAKRQALLESKAYLTSNYANTQALHLILKRLVKHYYGIEAANQFGEKWQEVVLKTTKTKLTNEELSRLYQGESEQPISSFHQKLVKAIKQFKVKGALNV
ncbi:DUF4381 domain-containing protein [Pseudoalteromonas piratica]|uniref:DUF4381 domain-containing protein n=1 Tax=Pseudoalteromonas piratica TaxID=1348114 RepID=A0A0A7EFY9_9GAMM|nr:DUF4381 domain-containing protein [Pseudoalteromonas piratica]AIY64976.1 hypothetical protein OM33_07290 [Pseudoalteromonas piratica]